MQCPQCQFENREEANFCKECGLKLEIACSQCGSAYEIDSKFCDVCGYHLDEESRIPIFKTPHEGERKHVTVLFSDLSGYTAMSEKLDPEDLKEMMNRIFEPIKPVVQKYEGFIEKFIGDAVMAIFGVPRAHEDDPIRAIKAAIEIHSLVEKLSLTVENKIGRPLAMHSGINTGLVVTGEVDQDKGTHGVLGDTINLASRLSNQASAGEILVGPDAYRLAEGYFNFENLGSIPVKGKADPVQLHKVLSQKDKPSTIRRISGVRADLVGRKAELAELSEAVMGLYQGKGRIFSICGAAGTGKSRLVEEFKASIDLDRIQWIEGHAYAYSQNIAYFPLVDLLNRLLHIEEKDSGRVVKEKIESSIASIVAKPEDAVPFVGALYSLNYPQVENVNPELWKSHLHEAILKILSALAERAPTVFFLEDLHWADPSFVELLHRAFLEIRRPAIVLCTYRPTFNLFTSHQLQSIGKYYREIQLHDLSLSDAQDMLLSLLKTEQIPSDLKNWVQSKAEGNPFYLEELVNSLIESQTLTHDNGNWQLSRDISNSEISSSLHGLISGRLDRLQKQTKRVLQEASVIGRDFLYEILKRITELDHNIDGELSHLERLDLIRARSLQPELEYMFKHALTQEIVYSSLLKKQRRRIHEQIARVMENVFKDRLSEFHEMLAFHYARGQSTGKAVNYLLKSGRKSLDRYAVSEAHQYFSKAFDILSRQKIESTSEKVILADLLNSWAYSYYYLGENKELIDLFRSQIERIDSLDDKARVGMFYAWFGIAHFMAGEPKTSYEYLHKGLELGEKIDDQKVIGYASTWLTFACYELGYFDEGLEQGYRAQKIAETHPSDPYLFFKSLAGLCFIHIWQGNMQQAFDGAQRLIDYGDRFANSRSKVFGHFVYGIGFWAIGDLEASQKRHAKAIEVALDPAYAQFPKPPLGLSYCLDGRLEEAETILQSCMDFCESRHLGLITAQVQYTLAPVLMAKGQMKQGVELMGTVQNSMLKNHRILLHAISEHILGEVYMQMATGPKPALSVLAKNIGFILRNVPSALEKSEKHFSKAIATFEEIGAKGLIGPSYLRLGQLHEANKKADKAKRLITQAIDIFKQCEATGWLKQANAALESLQ